MIHTPWKNSKTVMGSANIFIKSFSYLNKKAQK